MIGIFDIAMLALAAVLVLFALIKGCMRGGIRAFVRFLLVALCAVGAYLFSQYAVDVALATDVSAMGLTAADGTAFNGTLQEYVVSLLMSTLQGSGMESLFENPEIQTILFGIVAAIMAVIVFLVAFALFKALSLIVYAIIKIFIPKRRHGKKLKRSKLMGFLFSLLQAVVVYAVILIPVFGFLNVADVAVAEFKDSAFVEEDPDMKGMIDQVDGFIEESKGGMVYSFFEGIKFNNTDKEVDKEKISLREVAVKTFNEIYVIEVDGKKMYPLDEIVGLLPVVRNALDAADALSDLSNMTPENIQTLKDLLTGLGESDLVTSAVATVIGDAATAWANGEEFFGMSFTEDSGMDAATVELVQDFCEVIKNAKADEIKEDLTAIGACIEVLDNHGVFDKIADMGEDADVLTEVLNIIAEEKENGDGENTALIDDLAEALGESEHLSTLFPVLTNFGIHKATESLGVPKDKETAYDNMLGDISSAVGSAKDVDESAVDAEIERLASPEVIRNHANVYVPGYLAAEGNSSYAAWMNMNEATWKSMEKNGFKMGEAFYRKEINGTEYVYLGKDKGGNDRWAKYEDLTVETKAEVDSNKELTEAVQKLVTDLKENNEVTKEAVKDSFKVLTETIADETAKAIFESASSVENYKTAENVTVITYVDNFKIDVSTYFGDTDESRKEKMENVGAVMKDAAAAIIGITEVLSGEETDITKIDFEKLGTALDGIGDLTGRDNFATDIIKKASDSIEDPFMKDLMLDVADKMEESKNNPDSNEKFDFAVLGQSMQAASSLIAFFEDGKDFSEVTVEEWAEVLYNLTKVDSTTLGIVKNNVAGLLAGSSAEDEEEIMLFVTILLDAIKQQTYDSKDDPEALADGEAISDLAKYLMNEEFSELDGDEATIAVFRKFSETAENSGFVRTVIAALLNDMGECIKNNETHSMFPFIFWDFVSEDYDPENPTDGDKIIMAWLDAFIAITPETVADDLDTIIAFFETFSHVEDLDFVGDAADEDASPADNIEHAIKTATVELEDGETKTFREMLLNVFAASTTTTYNGLEAAIRAIEFTAE